MKFLIFIKQVPESTEELSFDPFRKTLVREGLNNTINPYDRRAVSEAIRYKNENGGEVSVCTMGPMQAREVLLEALFMGVDRAFHIQDKHLSGSDTLVTAKVLSAAARKIGFDILMCGQNSTDSETGQVGPQVAELLNVPFAGPIRKVTYSGRTVEVIADTEEGTATLRLPLPCMLAASERLIKPIKTKGMDLSAVPSGQITTLSLADLEFDPSEAGLEGSPTWVADIIEVKHERNTTFVAASQSPAVILEALQGAKAEPDFRALPLSASSSADGEFWCFVETRSNGEISAVSLELLANSSALSAERASRVCAVCTEPVKGTSSLLLSAYGAEMMYVAPDDHPEILAASFAAEISRRNPFAVLFPSSFTGKYLASTVAARLGLGLVGDCVGLKWDENGKLMQLKPAYGGMIVAPVYSRTLPQMMTVRPGALEKFKPRTGYELQIEKWRVPENASKRIEIVSLNADEGADALRMLYTKNVFCVGMGLGESNIPAVRKLAELSGGSLAATRRVVDAGWLPRQYQVGLTGKFIEPQNYIGLGVSGRINHTIAIRKSRTIIAINSDPNAEIFNIADIAVVSDAAAIVEKLLDLLQ